MMDHHRAAQIAAEGFALLLYFLSIVVVLGIIMGLGGCSDAKETVTVPVAIAPPPPPPPPPIPEECHPEGRHKWPVFSDNGDQELDPVMHKVLKAKSRHFKNQTRAERCYCSQVTDHGAADEKEKAAAICGTPSEAKK